MAQRQKLSFFLIMNNLIEETKEYWRDLDILEKAYQNGEVSIEEVDVRVAELTERLSKKRRETWRWLRATFASALSERREAVLGLTLIGVAVYIGIIAH